jgi:hypothetical protein
LNTTAKLVSKHNFEAYALVWNEPNPAGLVFTQQTEMGDPNLMIGMIIAHTFWAKEDADGIAAPFLATADVGKVVNARRDKWGLWIRGSLEPSRSPDTDTRIIRLLLGLIKEGQLDLTADTLFMSQRFIERDNFLARFPIVRFSLYVRDTEIAAGFATPQPTHPE